MMESSLFEKTLKEKTKGIEEILAQYLPEEKGYQKTVLQAMNYSVQAGGKRLRPMLMQEVYRLFGGQSDEICPFMAALEMIHTYSLVHDDLPAMDNDEYRRGRKTTHIVYGEAMAILAGDGLLNYAFETAVKAFETAETEYMPRVARALGILGRKAGIYGMIGGQTADIEAEDSSSAISGEQLLFIHEHKTAALIQAAMMIGAVLAGASDDDVARMEKCAYNVGIAFQIQDDILDVIGDSQQLGKPVGSDAANEKQTYVTIYGLEKSGADVAALSEEAVSILRMTRSQAGVNPEAADFLEQLITELIHRNK